MYRKKRKNTAIAYSWILVLGVEPFVKMIDGYGRLTTPEHNLCESGSIFFFKPLVSEISRRKKNDIRLTAGDAPIEMLLIEMNFVLQGVCQARFQQTVFLSVIYEAGAVDRVSDQKRVQTGFLHVSSRRCADTLNIHSTVQDKICAALMFAVVCHAGVPILGQKCEASNLVRQLKEPVCEGTLIGKICRPLQALLAERSLSVGYFCIAEYGV